MRYAWIITRDFIADPDEPEGSYCNAKGVAGPRGATAEEIAEAKANGYRFRLIDGDGEVYYHGRIWAEDGQAPTAKSIVMNPGWKDAKAIWVTYGPSADEQAAFGPLWDFGTPNAGAVDIQYRCPDPTNPGHQVWASL